MAAIAALVILVLVFAITYFLTMKADTLPIVDAFTDAPGLDGGDRILSHYSGACGTGDEYQELKLLLAKLAAFKIDIQSASGTLDATMYMPYVTKHDREQISETASRCISKSIPRRDLDIIVDLWSTRGHELIDALSKQTNTSPARAGSISKLFDAAIADVQTVALSKCLVGDLEMDKMAESPRDVIGITPEAGSLYVSSYAEGAGAA